MRAALISDHLGLARVVARRYHRRGIDAEDLYQVASLALVQAAARFDPAHGTPFAGYAAVCLHGELKRYLRDYAWAVRPPRPIHDLYLQVARATADLTHTLGAAPTISDIAHCLNVDPDRVRVAQEARTAYTAASLDALVQDHPDHVLFQLAPVVGTTGADTFEMVDLAVTIATLLRGLSPREQQIVGLRFGHEMTQQEIGDRLGISQMHVSRLLSSITTRLRTQLTSAA